ncbi:unnamed protein product [Ranitomeya imitator]|uniref:Tyr recombinase domain-containing protein n=1 Tax=Ranitomeya imitator TaxID=111125 RepID=A0ABN9LER5_9NEOB|nr:unnamed protein product [Ranitomeya imitator]
MDLLESAVRDRNGREGSAWLAALLTGSDSFPATVQAVPPEGRRSRRATRPPARLSPPVYSKKSARSSCARASSALGARETGGSALRQDSGTAGKETEAPQGGIPPLSRNAGEAIANTDTSKDTAAVAQQNMGAHHIILAPGRSHRQESSRRRSIHRMERQGPMTPVAREASCPDTGAPIGVTGTAPSGALGGGGLPTFDLGCPGDLMPLIRSSIAPSTWKAYGKAWEESCLLADGKPVGSSEDARIQVTMAFLSKMHAMGVSGSVARNRVSALAFHFKLRGWSDSTKHFLVSQLLKGWRRADKHGDNRRPISFDLLMSLVKAAEAVCDSKYEAALMSAAFGLAFFGAMRVSEIVPTALNKPGGLRREDILICDDGLRIRICKSKTDQDGRGTWFPIFAINKDICPLTLIRNYMRVRKHGSQFFIHENGLPLVSGQFLAILRRTLSLLGMPAAKFGTHSFRIGAATEASRAGLFESEIQRVDGVRPSVWIVGHSYIYWAARRAELCPGGRSLGFDDVDVIWRGLRGMMWSQVLPEVVHIARVASSPTIVVIHAGGNDLASSPLAELLTLIRSDMDKFPSFFPLMRLVWSEVIPRLVWRGARELNAMERSRRTLNQRISRFVRFKNGVVVRHHRLEGDNSGFLLPDGVHLNEAGLDIFLNGIREEAVARIPERLEFHYPLSERSAGSALI